MKGSICVVTSVLVAAAMVPIGFSVAEADNGNHDGSDKQNKHGQTAHLTRNDHDRDDNKGKHANGENHNQRHNQTAHLTRNDHDKDDNNGKHANGENHNQRHDQTAQLTRNDHDKDDNNGKHVGWHKHLGNPTGGDHPTASVPEPGSLVLLGAGMAGIGFLRRMFRKA